MVAVKQQPPALNEKLAKFWRGFQRGSKAFFGGASARLAHEKNQAVVKGKNGDISRLKGLDLQIASMVRTYEGVGRVPDKVADKIEKHVRDLTEVFARVAAVKMDSSDVTLADVMAGKLEKESPLRDLEFVSTYTSPAGAVVEQRLAKVRLG